jgi:hypothetical protein
MSTTGNSYFFQYNVSPTSTTTDFVITQPQQSYTPGYGFMPQPGTAVNAGQVFSSFQVSPLAITNAAPAMPAYQSPGPATFQVPTDPGFLKSHSIPLNPLAIGFPAPRTPAPPWDWVRPHDWSEMVGTYKIGEGRYGKVWQVDSVYYLFSSFR